MKKGIEMAIELLRKNDYFVRKIPKSMCEEAEKCSDTGCGDCQYCDCFSCIIGND